MKEYIIFAKELFNIKSGILKLTIKGNRQDFKINRDSMFDTARQLRNDLEQLEEEFTDSKLSITEKKEIKKINEKIMVKYAIMRRRIEREIAEI